MILMQHAHAIEALVTSYRNLPRYQQIFFPEQLASALSALPALPQEYTAENLRSFILVCLNTHSPFIPTLACLQEFLSTPLMRAVMEVSEGGSIDCRKFAAIVTSNPKADFLLAVAHGDVELLRILCTNHPEIVEEIVRNNNFAEEFFLAAKNDHCEVLLVYLESIVSADVFQIMITEHCIELFRIGSEKGNLPLLQYLEAKAPDKLQDMIANDDYFAFRKAAANGHLEVLRYLGDKSPDKLQDMIAAKDYYAFRFAAAKGHISVLQHLEAKALDKLQQMIAKDNYGAFRYAAANGHLEALKYLEAKAPDKLQDMIAKYNYSAFYYAAGNGHLEVLKYLEEKVPDGLRQMIEGILSTLLLNILINKSRSHPVIFVHLLDFPRVFAYAEMHVREYGRAVREYTTKMLTELHDQKDELERSSPLSVFDVDATKAKQLFYVARHLIRLNLPEVHYDLVFLLRIPALRALAHQAIRPGLNEPFGEANQLVRLALSVNNRAAAQCLLQIPKVRLQAEANNYYRAESRDERDLRALAQNRESSMTALTQGERRRIQGVTDRYQPQMDELGGASQVLQDLRKTLESRYAVNPASIFGEKGTIQLPQTWKEFEALKLGPNDSQAALKAYYAHKDHSAWRYLLKPNPWMHERASYIYVNPERTQEKWSVFEEYEALIGILYLAAKDEGIAPTDGYTLESRLEQFITELSLIGRAHNLDKSRVVQDAKGCTHHEEYDEAEGDRPSCFSGTLISIDPQNLFKERTPTETPATAATCSASFFQQSSQTIVPASAEVIGLQSNTMC